MTKEQLLIKRWKVIADYPQHFFLPPSENKIKIGDVLEQYATNSCIWRKSVNGLWTEDTVHYPESYPAIFRELHWSEGREISDLPEYVKGVDGYYKGKIFKIAHPSQNGRIWHVDNEIEHQTFLRWTTDFIPADESEYNDYINSKTK